MMKTTLYFYLIGSFLFILIRYFIGLDGLYGQDSYEYQRYTDVLNQFIINGEKPDNYFWPVYYPLIGSILKIIIPKTSFVLQLVSAFSLITTLIYLKKIILITISKKTEMIDWYLISFFLLSPMIFRMGFLCMSDMLSLLFIVVSIYHYLSYFNFKNLSNLYFAVLFTLLATLTRYASCVLLFPFGLYMIFYFIRTKSHYLHLFGLLSVSILVIIPHYFLKNQNPIAFLNHNWLQYWSFSNFFKSSFLTVDGFSNNYFPNLIYAISNTFHPRFFLLGFPLIIIAISKKTKIKYFWLIFSSYLLYTLFMAGIPFQNNRFLVLSFPILLLLLYLSFYFVTEIKFIKKYQKNIFSILIILNLSMSLYGLKPILKRNSFEKEMVSVLKPYQNNILYSFDIDIALKGRDLKFNYQNLWIKEYDTFAENSLLLFHPTKFKEQWENKNPMKNWNFINTKYNLQIVKKCPDGWNLYKITLKN